MVINKTPHAVIILNEKNEVIRTYDKCDEPIRLQAKIVKDEPLPDGTPTTKTEFGSPEGLPEYSNGVYYIVSQIVKNALPQRKDLLVPAEVVRGEDGTIYGCKSLGR